MGGRDSPRRYNCFHDIILMEIFQVLFSRFGHILQKEEFDFLVFPYRMRHEADAPWEGFSGMGLDKGWLRVINSCYLEGFS